MNARLHPVMAAALLPFAPPQSVVHKIVATSQALPDVDPKVLRNEAQALRLEQSLPESLRGVL